QPPALRRPAARDPRPAAAGAGGRDVRLGRDRAPLPADDRGGRAAREGGRAAPAARRAAAPGPRGGRALMLSREWFTAAELAEMALPGMPNTERGVQLHADR